MFSLIFNGWRKASLSFFDEWCACKPFLILSWWNFSLFCNGNRPIGGHLVRYNRLILAVDWALRGNDPDVGLKDCKIIQPFC
jgi:hypothetical protein